MNAKYLQIVKTRWFLATGCFVLGVAIILGIRFFTYSVDSVHYHANFALYINGHREEFKGIGYYTEVEMCTLNTTMVPSERAHMHDNVNDVVHVEDHAVTWGQFFSNLGWIMGPTSIISPGGAVYAKNGNNKLHIMLNNQDYTDFGGLQNTVIKDKDKLLVSFGDESDGMLKQQYDSIPATAQKYDMAKDPASCSGNHGTTTNDRLKHLL
jgi:hypothetical protein